MKTRGYVGWGLLFAAALWSGCGDDDNPMAPGTELVGSWILVSSNELNAESIARVQPRLTFEADGTMIITRTLDGVVTQDTRRWRVVTEGALEETLTIDGQEVVRTWQYTLEGGTLTLLHEGDDGETRFLEVYERGS